MTVIFKKEKFEDVVERSKIRSASRGSTRNLIISRCLNCKMPFETIMRYRRKTCMLCRYENMNNREAFLASLKGKRKWDEKGFYEHYLAKAVLLENRKRRILKASGCRVLNLAKSYRLSPFESYLDPIPNN